MLLGMEITEKNIIREALNGNLSVLDSPLVGYITNNSNIKRTSLHILALRFKHNRVILQIILNHPDIDKVKDCWEKTPLHYISDFGLDSVLNHPSIDKIRDYRNHTPLHKCVLHDLVTKEWLKKKYPWFKLGDRKITCTVLDEILSYSNAEKFICF